MKYNSLAMICQAVVYGAFSPILVYLGYGAFGAVQVTLWPQWLSVYISVIMLYFTIFRKLENKKISDFQITSCFEATALLWCPSRY